jgi:hypothetical protein
MNAKAEEIHQITEFTKTEAGLSGLEEKYKSVPDAATEDGYTACVEAIRELRPLRTGLDKLRLALNADDQKRIKFRNAEASRITDRLTAMEEPIKAAKVAVDTEKERIEEAARQAEVDRIEGIQAKIGLISEQALVSYGETAKSIESRLIMVQSIGINEDVYGEYLGQAQLEQMRIIGLLEKAHKERSEHEAGQAELKRLQAEQAAVAAKQAEAQAKLDSDRKAIEAERQEASRVMREAQEKAEEAKRKVEADKLAVERAEKDRLQAELDAKVKAEREAKEVEERQAAAVLETERMERLRPDKDKLMVWADTIKNMEGPLIIDTHCEILRQECMRKLGEAGNGLIKSLGDL